MSKQKDWQDKMRGYGRCPGCGGKPKPTRVYCVECIRGRAVRKEREKASNRK